MKFDKLLEQLGGFGVFQKQQYVLLCFPAMFTAMHNLAWVFLGATPPHRCKIPNFNSSFSDSMANLSIPWDFSENTWSKCIMYDLNYTDYNTWVETNITIQCKEWEYYDSEYTRTVVMDWDLVCNQNWLEAAAQASFMIGVLFACIIIGVMADRFGRAKVFFWSTFFMALSGILTIFAPEIITFLILRGITGASQCGLYYTIFVQVTELVGPSSRATAGLGIMCLYAIGYLILALLAYFLRDWIHLQLAITCPLLLFLLYWWFVPESIRWLIAQQRYEEAEKILKIMAKKNKISSMPPTRWKQLAESNDTENWCKKKLHSISLLLSTSMMTNSLIMFFTNFTTGLLYFGLSLNILNLGGNNFINFAIGGAVEIPAYFMSNFAMNAFGRRRPLCFCLIVGGIVLLANGFVPKTKFYLLVTFNMIGRFLSAGSTSIASVFCTELYPTIIRMMGLGLNNIFSRLGAIVAPFFLLMHGLILPLTFGLLSLTAGLLTLLLPETHNKTLPDTIEDVKALSRKYKFPPKSIKSEVVNERETCI